MSWGLQTVRTGKGCDRLKGTHLRRPQREDMSVQGNAASQTGVSRAREGMPNAPVWVEISRPAREWKVKPDIVVSMKSGLLGAQGLA